jgi:hypothetical protein
MSRRFQFCIQRILTAVLLFAPLTIIVVLAVAAGIALANLSSDPVTGELLIRLASKPERAYGWPLTWYWRIASIVPGRIQNGGGASRPVIQWPLARYSASGLIAKLAIWLILVAGPAAACQRLLKRCQLRLRWRPRVTTLFVLLAIAVLMVLANLSFETSPLSPPYFGVRSATTKALFGWPLLWNWYFVAPWENIYGWDFSAARLAGNLVIWLGTLGAVACVCEWLMRRYRPRLSFSLRTMLATVLLASLLCAWCATVWRRANDQDALAVSDVGISNIRVRRWGPKGLGLVVPDRYRRLVVDVDVSITRPVWPEEHSQDADKGGEDLDYGADQENQANDDGSGAFDNAAEDEDDRQEEELLRRLTRLSGLRALSIECHQLVTPAMAGALGKLRQLRALEVSLYIEGHARADVSWIDRLSQLEKLRLTGVGSDQLAGLTHLTHLKSLRLDLSDCEDDELEMDKRLAIIGKLTQLRRLHLEGSSWHTNRASARPQQFEVVDARLRSIRWWRRTSTRMFRGTWQTDAARTILACRSK